MYLVYLFLYYFFCGFVDISLLDQNSFSPTVLLSYCLNTWATLNGI
jgi:hypothetical protein